MARGGNSVVVIKWRDIPAQVNAQMGRDRFQIVLSAKFQRAIDRAKRKANIYTAEEDIAQWSRDSLPLEGTLAEAAQRWPTKSKQNTRANILVCWHMRVDSKRTSSNSRLLPKIWLLSKNLKKK